MTDEEAYAIIRESAGKHFDPRVVRALFSSINDIEKVQTQE